MQTLTKMMSNFSTHAIFTENLDSMPLRIAKTTKIVKGSMLLDSCESYIGSCFLLVLMFTFSAEG